MTLKVRLALAALATCWLTVVVLAQPAAPQTTRSVWDGVYTAAQAERGRAVYERECAHCHGPRLEGNGETAGPLSGIEFLSTWNGLTLGDLVDRIRLTMPLDKPGKLGRQQHADVLAYIVSVNRFPAGETELPPESERLKQIAFDAVRGKR